MKPRDITIGCVAALATNDQGQLAQLEPEFAKLSVGDILSSLAELGRLIEPALTPEMRLKIQSAIKDELQAQPISGPVRDGAFGTAVALLIEPDGKKVGTELARHASAMAAGGTDLIMACMMASARVVNDLDITLDFR